MKFKDKCYICGSNTEFYIDDNATLLREAKCTQCGASMRNSDVAKILTKELIGTSEGLRTAKLKLENFHILNMCSSGYIHDELKELPYYTAAEFFDDVPSGSKKNGVLCVDLQHIPFNDDSIDVIISEDVLEHVENPELAFSEINRVLKIGGCIFGLYHFTKERRLYRE